MKHPKIPCLLIIILLTGSFTEIRAQSNVGTEFYLAFPANWEVEGSARYIRLYISSRVETNVDIYTLGQFKQSLKTVPNGIVTVDLTPAEAQIFVRNDQAPVPDDQIYNDKAVRIVAQDPVIIYGMNRTNFTSDGFLALPVSALGKEYVVASAASVESPGQRLPAQYMVIAPFDNTTVTITNPTNTPNHQEGETVQITLNRGDVFSAMSVGNGGDLTGAHILASQPVAVTAGQNCTYLPDIQYPACDHLVEMMMPVTSWGRVYNTLPFQNRTKGDTYRILAGEPGAEIFINGVKYAVLSKVGGEQGVGWIEFRENQRRPLTFSSNKLIQVVQYNNSQSYDQAGGSDPFYTLLSSAEQYQSQLLFSTLADFPQNYVYVVGDSLGIATAEISPAGEDNWQKMGSLSSTVSYTFPETIGGTHYAGLMLANLNGFFQVRSSGKLGGVVYAGSNFDSYGFPMSLLLENRSIVDTTAPLLDKRVECSGTVDITVRDMPDDPALRSNLSTVWLDRTVSSNYGLSVDPFIPGENRTAELRLQVLDPQRDAYGVIEIRDHSGNVVYDTLEYIAPRLVLTTTTFDTARPGVIREAEITIENQGSGPFELTRLMLSSGSDGFSVDTTVLPLVIPASGSRVIPVQFSSDRTGTHTGVLTIEDSCGLAWNVTLQGVVVDTLSGVRDAQNPKHLLDLSIQPNPVPNTGDLSLTFTLRSRMPVRIEMFNAAGERVRGPEERVLEPGENRQTIRIADFPSGVYYLVVKGDGEKLVQSCMVVR